MKIFSAEQLKNADEVSIENQNITSEDLMERAASLVFNEIHKRLEGSQIPIKIFCGIGNNGGDGLVVARLLIEHGYRVTTYVVNYSEHRSKDFLSNYHKLKEITNNWPILLKASDDLPEISSDSFVIDAIFGIGLNRSLDIWVAALIKHISDSGAFILAVDMPSGLFSDKIPEKDDVVLNANFTITFQAPKLIFFLPETMDYVGQLQVVDIGLDRGFLKETEAVAHVINRSEARGIYKPRKANSHKGTYGHTLIVGGSHGKIGSTVLAATAALRAGAGLCTLFIPNCGYEILQTTLPEAMVLTDKDDFKLTNINFNLEPDVTCFGIGAGTDPKTEAAFYDLLKKVDKPMVIDADGLNLLSNNKKLLDAVPKKTVLTPHPKELQRLIGDWKDDFDKIEKIQNFVTEYQLVLVLKGAHSFIFSGHNIYINNSGNSGMATAGSGDVLSGVITALIAQSYTPEQAAVLGVYLHGLSGDICVDEFGQEGILSGDIAKNMGKAFMMLNSENREI